MLKTPYTTQYRTLLAMLREARSSAGLTQIEMAKRLDISQSDVSKCEHGFRRLDVIELKLWIEALGGDFSIFLDDFYAQLEADQHGKNFPVRS